MGHYITVGELAGLLTVLWLPIFGVTALAHWQLLDGRLWRFAWVLAAFVLGVLVAGLVWLSPISHLFVYLGTEVPLLAIGGIPIQAALFSAVLVTVLLLLLRKLGLPPNNSFKPTPLRGSA